jgi:hypothetical protein
MPTNYKSFCWKRADEETSREITGEKREKKGQRGGGGCTYKYTEPYMHTYTTHIHTYNENNAPRVEKDGTHRKSNSVICKGGMGGEWMGWDEVRYKVRCEINVGYRQ